MSVNKYNLKVWFEMARGKSVFHVNQKLGCFFVPGRIEGYFNDLTEKVLKDPDYSIDKGTLPIDHEENGDFVFPVGVFQYGLGAYDLFLGTNDERYLKQFKLCADWALSNQESSGAWNNFYFRFPNNPYGAMCQGEGISLLVRAYSFFQDQRYYQAANKAASFMLKDVGDGGTSLYKDDELILLEYTHLPAVLNGWIFSIFGLYDLSLLSSDSIIKQAYEKTIQTLKRKLKEFDCFFWSKYDLGRRLTSPFYHRLHIAQLEALYLVCEDSVFDYYRKKWKRRSQNPLCILLALIIKVFQKILE